MGELTLATPPGSGHGGEPSDRSSTRRFFHDGELWIVRERPARPFDVPSAPHLVFESDSVIRRVRNFPVGWRDLDTDALYALSWSR